MYRFVTRLNPSNPNNSRDGIETVFVSTEDSPILQEALAADKWESLGTDKIRPKDDKEINTSSLELQNTVWDDMQVALGAIRQGASAAAWTPYRGSEVLAFAKNASNKIFFTIQYSHRIKNGSDTEFHIHTVAPDNGTGGVVWQLTVSYSRIDGTFGTEDTPPKVIQTIAANSANKHGLVVIKNPFTEDTGISTVALCSLSRLGNDGADDYDNNIYLVALDSHFQIDTMGSKQIYSK